MTKRMTKKAFIAHGLMDKIDDFFGGKEGHRKDPIFIELCKRIEGKTVQLVFTHGDAFEIQDDNYWLPPCCYEILGEKPK